MTRRVILWLVIVAAAAAVVAFVLSSIASGSGWLLAVAFTPAVAIIVFRLLRRPRARLSGACNGNEPRTRRH